MNISSKGRYAIRALADMAYMNADGRTALSEVAKRQDISLNYLEQIFAALRKGGLVSSVKGAGGGYILSLPPARMSMRSILDAVEGDLELIESSETQSPSAQTALEAVNESLWAPLEKALNRFLDQITVADIVAELEQQQQAASDMYYI